MKKILLILCLFPILVFSQKSYKIPADSTILNNIGSGKNELVIRNATSNITGGVLTNLGNGVTAFVLGGGSARVVDTIYKNNTKDSIVFTISGIRYAVKDSFNLNTDSQTLSISNDTLTISGGNSVILPVYIQIDSSTINSYDVLNSQNTPPISPNTGDVYLVGNVPTGAWVGHAKDIAEWNGSAWVFTDGVQGDFLYNATNALTYIFRSGNWVQTTGIPALNNGNIISSGLRIGTNNARSLTFETNNVNRGRFDSVGRFHIYNLPISTDTFVNVVDENGKFGKVGKSSIVDTTVISTKDNVTSLLLSKANQSALNDSVTTLRNIRKVDSSYSFRNASLDSICQIVIINGNSTRSCIKDSTGGGGASLSGLTAATASNTINSGANAQEWQWNTLGAGIGLKLSSSSTAPLSGNTLFSVNQTGAVATGYQTVYAAKISNTKTGVTTNYGLEINVGGTAQGSCLVLTNTSSNGAALEITAGSKGIQMNSNHLFLNSSTQSIGYSGGVIQYTAGSTQHFFTSTNKTPVSWCEPGLGSGYFSYSRPSTFVHALVFGGDLSGSSYRSETTYNNMIKSANGTLTITANTGVTGGFAAFTPTDVLSVYGTNTNVGIGTTTPVASAALDITSTTKGFLPPRMTAKQASAISTPAQGLLLFVSDTNGTFTSVGWWGYNGSTWEKLNN